jgi:hypothetical protein
MTRMSRPPSRRSSRCGIRRLVTAAATTLGVALAAGWLVSATPAAAAPPKTPKKGAATVQAAPKRASSPAPAAKATRGRKDLGTLDEINIEGEISVPQVLFITARDRARYHDPFYRRYLKSSAELVGGIPFPLPRGARTCP